MTPVPRRVGLAAIATVLLVFSALTVVAEECSGRKEAYSSEKKIREAKRRAGIENACLAARAELIGRAWTAGALVQTYSAYRTATEVDIEFFETSRTYSKIHSLLLKGECRETGDRKTKHVKYCVEQADFDEAVEQLKRERETEIEHYRTRFAGVERAMAEGDVRWASQQIRGLVRVVRTNVLDDVVYRSPLSDEALTFSEWLDRWQSEITFDDNYIRDSLYEVRELIADAHLSQAERVLHDVSRVEPRNPEVRRHERAITAAREQRAEYLSNARRMAKEGKYAAAERMVAKARAIDSDDATSLQDVRREIGVLRTQFVVYNPRWSFGGHIGMGSLGLDKDTTVDRVNQLTFGNFTAMSLIDVGFDLSFRLGRIWENQWTLGYGFSGFELGENTDTGVELGYWQFGTAFGLRTVRKTQKSIAVSLSVGIAGERADVSGLSLGDIPTSDTAVGAFARLKFGRKSWALYVQHGFGFEDKESGSEGLIAWKDGIQGGLIWQFASGTKAKKK